jgi:periplasmic divalent cation tolerance protein
VSDAYCVMLTTTNSQDEADRLAGVLVSGRLAACVQISAITSHYMWKGEMSRDSEYLLLIKTATHLYSEVEAAILENHSYETPEIVQLPITQGWDRYLGWIGENTR